MAELLVKAVSHSHTDPTKDLRGCYKRGDVVLVRENGHTWGGLELKPPNDGGKFVVIKITDVTLAQVINWVLNHWSCPVESDDGTRRRRVKIDVDLVPPAVLQELNLTGQFTTTWIVVREFVRNKETNATAEGEPI